MHHLTTLFRIKSAETFSILQTINASIDAISKLKKTPSFNLSDSPPGLDGKLSEEQSISEARCRNHETSRPKYILWTSHDSSHHFTKQLRHDLTEIPPPTLLWAFPGSGTPWLRLLIEYATGYLTSSVAVDNTVSGILSGETHGCDRGVLLLYANALENKINRLISSPIKYICNKKVSNLNSHFDRILMIIRNPYDTFWENYMKEMYQKHNLMANGKLRKGVSAVVDAKHGMIRRLYFEQVHFRERMLSMAIEWLEYLDGIDKWEKKFPHNHLVVQLEQLFSVHSMGSEEASGQTVKRQPWLRCLALGRVLAFLGQDVTAAQGGITSGDRCSCAFVLASAANWDHSAVERAPRRYVTQVPEKLVEGFVSRDEVYGDDPQLVCSLWQLVRKRAVRFGYRPWGTTRCFA